MALPERFSQLRKQIFKDHLIETWRDVVNEINTAVEEVKELGSNAISRVSHFKECSFFFLFFVRSTGSPSQR